MKLLFERVPDGPYRLKCVVRLTDGATQSQDVRQQRSLRLGLRFDEKITSATARKSQIPGKPQIKSKPDAGSESAARIGALNSDLRFLFFEFLASVLL